MILEDLWAGKAELKLGAIKHIEHIYYHLDNYI